MMLTGAVVFDGGTEGVGGPLVAFAVGPAGKLELAGDDGSPVGRIEGTVVLAGAVALGPEVTGAVPFAALVTFAEGEAGTVPLADVGAAPLSDGPGGAVGAVPLPVEGGAVPLMDVGAAPPDGPADGEAVGAVPLPVEGVGAAPDAEVPLPGDGGGAVVFPGAGGVSEVGSGPLGPVPVEVVPLIDVPLVGRGGVSVVAEAVTFVGSGSAKVVEFSGTMILVAVDTVAFVGAGGAAAVEFNGTGPLVEAGAGSDALLGAAPELGTRELAPVPDGGSTGAVPLSVGKGGGVVEDPGSGGKEVSPEGRGAKIVVELATMIRLVAAADPLMVMVVTPVMAPTDEIALMGVEVEDSLPGGGGAPGGVELAGIEPLVTGAVSLVTMVVRLPVIIPEVAAVVPEIEGDDALAVGKGATTVEELRGTMMLVAVAVPLTKTVETPPGISLGLAVLLANGAEDGTPEALGDSEGGGAGVTVVTDGPTVKPRITLGRESKTGNVRLGRKG